MSAGTGEKAEGRASVSALVSCCQKSSGCQPPSPPSLRLWSDDGYEVPHRYNGGYQSRQLRRQQARVVDRRHRHSRLRPRRLRRRTRSGRWVATHS